MKITLEDATTKYHSINKCEIRKLSLPEEGSYYLTKNKNLKLTDLESFHFDFYREKLLDEYRNPTAFIHSEIERMKTC